MYRKYEDQYLCLCLCLCLYLYLCFVPTSMLAVRAAGSDRRKRVVLASSAWVLIWPWSGLGLVLVVGFGVQSFLPPPSSPSSHLFGGRLAAKHCCHRFVTAPWGGLAAPP